MTPIAVDRFRTRLPTTAWPGEPTFLGLFQDQRNAEDYAAKIENARVERVALRDTARAFDAKALIG